MVTNARPSLTNYWTLVVIFSGLAVRFTLGLANLIPAFVKEPQSVLDFSNNTGGHLDCVTDGVPKPTISWTYADGKSLAEIPGLRQVLSNGSLHFAPFAAQDYRQDVHATVYRCRASSTLGKIVSRDIRVRAVVLQIYEAQVYDEFVIEGNTAVLKCHIPSFVAEYVSVTSWRKDGSFIYPSTDEGVKHNIMPTGELHISDVQAVDAYPTYRCYTKHRLTEEERPSAGTGRLFVTRPHGSVPPRITDSKVSVVAKEGGVAILPCVAQGYPLPEITWFIKKEDESLARLRFDGKFLAVSSWLRIHQLAVADSAVYVCFANNTVGSEKAETTVIVTAPLSVYIQPERKVVDLGQPAAFHCVTSGVPISSLTWLKDGRPLTGDKGYRHMKDMLQFSNAKREDQGLYQCLISSETDSAQATAELKLGDIAPVLHSVFSEDILNPTARTSLQCSVSGSPQPEVHWTLDGMALNKNNRLTMETVGDSSGKLVAFLNISSIRTEDGGFYSCIASNKAGQAQHTARLNVYGRPYIRALPKFSAVAGHDFTIRCPATGYPISGITWEKGGRELPISHHQVVFPNGTLQVKSVQRTLDAGKYTCKVRNGDGQTASRDFEVMIMVPPHIIPFSFMGDYVLEGMLARITCVVTRGDLPLTFTWIKDGRLITPDLGVMTRTFDEFSVVLTINSVTSRHNGNYTCIASNPAGSANHTAQLMVNVPPRWVVEPEDVDVLAGNKVVLNCQVEGFPLPTIQWMKAVDNKPGEYKIPSLDDPNVKQYSNGSLVLSKARMSDAGQYLCRASNGIGAPLGLVIKVHVQVPVHFDVKVTNQTAHRDERCILRCEAKGELPIRVSWSINGLHMKFETLTRFTYQEIPLAVGLASEINIARADRKDTGTYTCLAINKYGRDEMHIHLMVNEIPEAPGPLKVSDKTSRSVTLSWAPPFDGNSPIVKYVVQYKHASVSWQEKSINFTVPGSETTSTISYLQPAANYHIRILAINGLGTSDPSDVIVVTTLEEAPAGPPVDIKAESVGTDAIRVTWKPPKPDLWNGQIRGYYVGYRLYEASGAFTFKTVETTGNSLEPISVNLTHLKKFTRYSIIVQAFNHVGTSPRSDELLVLTSEDVPSMAPEEVKCSALSSQSLHVSWNVIPPGSMNGILQGYKVVYNPVDEWYDRGPEIKLTTGSKTVLSGLGKYTNYSVQILGFTRVGDGVKATPVYCVTNEDVPEAPAEVKVAAISSDAAMVTWRKPVRPNGNISKYTVYKRTTDRDKEDIEKYTVPADRLHYETSGLKKGRRYEFWVTASTSIGEGQSTRVVVYSPSGPIVPAKIMSFAGQHNVSWKSPLILPCKAVGIPAPEREWKFRGQVIGSSSTVYVRNDGYLVIHSTEVTDAGSYSCRAQNTYGNDEISYLVKVQVPPPPPVLDISAATFHSLEVRWRHDRDDDIPVTAYFLHYKRDFGEWERIVIEAFQQSYSLSNLDCGTRYHLYIVGVNRIGEGSPSEVITTRTEGAAPTMPRKHAFIRESSTFVTLHLDAWISGCTILYFVVHYRMRTDSNWHLVSNNVLLQQKEFIIPDLAPGTWYQLMVTAHNNAGSTVADYNFATLTSSGGALPELADGIEMEEGMPFYFNATTMIISVVCLIVTFVLIATICICCRRKIIRSNLEAFNIPPPHTDSLPRLSTETMKNVSSSSSNYLLNSNNRPFVKPAMVDTPTSDLSRDISPYATSQIPGCYSRDTRTLNHRFSPHVYPPLRDLQEIRDGTYPGTRKLTLQRLQQCSRPESHYSIGYRSPLSSLDDMAITRVSEFEIQPWLNRPSAPSLMDQNDHGLESNSSAVSSPELSQRKPLRAYEVSMRRGSADSGSDGFVTQETSFTFYPMPEVKTLQYRTEPEFSDTESELDNLHKKKMAALMRLDAPVSALAALSP